ncbi:hypothetical protein P1P70_02885 [Streptomyces sp. MB09-02B]|nr:hypothetical protein [Streptomyces sp. MB09-02B]
MQVTDWYGTVGAMDWDRIHPWLTTRSAWIDRSGEVPVAEGTLIRLQVDGLRAATIRCRSGRGRRPPA